jgi:tryptophanyl-tRNA synthetase
MVKFDPQFIQKKLFMARILTGIQSTGNPHLGNILGAMQPAIALSNDPKNEAFLFIADMHSLTTVHDPDLLRQNTYVTAAAWLAFGLDIEKNTFYRQSDVPEVAELSWYLNCFTPYPMLANAHSFKDKANRLSDVNAGLFTYPVLMAADIILYDADYVPVGKDQKQHLEMTRDIAASINRQYGDTFVIPEPIIDEQVKVIPGMDGQKMSKSYNNFIDIFLPEKKLRKQIMKIVTDDKTLEERKDPDNSIIVDLYKHVASADATEQLKAKFRAGNYGYGHAKQALFEAILEKFEVPRKHFEYLIKNRDEIDQKLKIGAEKARFVAQETLNRVRSRLGYASC